jgi:uncharacterized protein (TIGR02246 family)
MTTVDRKMLLCLIFPSLLASLTASPSSAQLRDASAEDAIEAANERFMEAFGEGDAEAIATLYTDDAVLLAPHLEPLEGREAVADYMRGAIEQGLTELDLETTEVMQHDDMAVEVGEYALFAGDRRADQGKYLVVWKRDEDTWMLHRDMMNTSIPQQRVTAEETEAPPEMLEIAGASASSAWAPRFSENNVYDGSERNHWRAKKGDSRGAWVELLLREPKTATGMRVYTRGNAHPRQLTLEFSDGSRQSVELRGLQGWEAVEFDPVTTNSVRIVFERLVRGEQWFQLDEVELMGY